MHRTWSGAEHANYEGLPMYNTNNKWISRSVIDHLHEGSTVYAHIDVGGPEADTHYDYIYPFYITKISTDKHGDRIYTGTLESYYCKNDPQYPYWVGPAKTGDFAKFKDKHISRIIVFDKLPGDNPDLLPFIEEVPPPPQ